MMTVKTSPAPNCSLKLSDHSIPSKNPQGPLLEDEEFVKVLLICKTPEYNAMTFNLLENA